MSDVTRTVGLRVEIETAPANAADKVKAKVSEIGKEAEKTSAKTKKASSEMAAGFKGLQDQASALPGPIGQVGAALGNVSQGVSAFKSGLTSLRGAILSSGIFALAIALGSLYAYFTESEKGAQQFRVILGYINGITEALVGQFEDLGATMVKAFQDPMPAVKEFGKSIFSFLSNPTYAIGQMVGKMEALGKEVRETSNAFAELARRANELKVAEREMTVERAKSNKTIAEARLIADDATKSTEERIKAVRKAGALESEVADEEQRIAKERLRLIEDRIKAGEGEEAVLDELAQAKARVYELERETIMRTRRLLNEEMGLRREAAAKQKEIDDAEKARLDELAKANEEYMASLFARFQAGMDADYKESQRLLGIMQETEDLRIAMIQDGQMREEMEIVAAYQRKVALIVGQSAQEQALRLALQDKMMADLNAIEKKYLDQSVKANQVAAQAKMTAYAALGQTTIGIGKVVSAAMADNAEVAKGIATAEIWINAASATASAIQKAVQSSMTPYDMIANIAVAVGTVAGAIASTIEILNKADIPGGSNASVGSMPSFTATAPTGTPVSTNVTGLVNTQQAELQPIQAFVVETQITGAQGNVEQIYGQASFGLGG